MKLAEVLVALSHLAWPVLAGVVLWRTAPALVRAFANRGFTVEIGNSKLTVQEASDLLRMQIYDLQGHVTHLRRSNGGGALAPVWSRKSLEGGARPRVFWIEPEPSRAANEAGVLYGNGVDVEYVSDADRAPEVLASDTGTAPVVLSRIGAAPSPEKSADFLRIIQRISAVLALHPLVVYTDPQTARENREEFLRAGARTVVSSPLDLYENLDVTTEAATSEFVWKRIPR